jgi:hypothetical protein
MHDIECCKKECERAHLALHASASGSAPTSPPTGSPGPTTERGNADAPPADLIDLHSPLLIPGENISGMMATMNLLNISCFIFMHVDLKSLTILQRFAWRCKSYTVVSWASTHSRVSTHVPLASSPGLLIGVRRERESLVSTACVCTVIIQILNNLITYGYFLVYLPFDLNSRAQRT